MGASGKGSNKMNPVEQDANARALKYFVGKYGEGFANRIGDIGWDNSKHTINNYDWSQSFSSENNQAAIKNAKIGFSA